MERIDISSLDKNYVADESKVVIPEIKHGDMASMLTREQAICLPNDIKKELVYGNYKHPEEKFDAALVLGGDDTFMPSRAEAAAKLYHSGQCELFITTGKICHNTQSGYITEAQALAEYMVNAGVPRECILTEENATTTRENMKFSRQMLAEHYGNKKLEIAIVTSYFHHNRSVRLAKSHIENQSMLSTAPNQLKLRACHWKLPITDSVSPGLASENCTTVPAGTGLSVSSLTNIWNPFRSAWVIEPRYFPLLNNARPTTSVTAVRPSVRRIPGLGQHSYHPDRPARGVSTEDVTKNSGVSTVIFFPLIPPTFQAAGNPEPEVTSKSPFAGRSRSAVSTLPLNAVILPEAVARASKVLPGIVTEAAPEAQT